jgi:hypothetical protein
MNDPFFPNDPAGVFFEIRLPGFDATWAGANPLGPGFCLGSETGHIVFTDETGRPTGEPRCASASEEPVNGVAYSLNWLAVTTRRDINLLGPFGRAQAIERITFHGGGHDVAIAPTSGHFVIPLGPGGLMFLRPGTSDKDPVTISKPDESSLNFCRAIALPGHGGSDVIVCAGRRGGLGYADYGDGIFGHVMHTVTFPGLDIVDVCSLAAPEKPRAVVAAAKDASLAFFDDILTDKTPRTIRFKKVLGTVYRVLAGDGHVFLLTTNGLFSLFGLAAALIDATPPERLSTEILRLPIEAADANMVGSKWLLAVGTESLFRFDVEKMPRSAGGEEPEQFVGRPMWGEAEMERNCEPLAMNL